MHVADKDLRTPDNEPEPVVITPPVPDQRLVGVIEQEKTLQVRAGRHTVRTPVRGLSIGQELHRHKRTINDPQPGEYPNL
jgi:hypothetical protein